MLKIIKAVYNLDDYDIFYSVDIMGIYILKIDIWGVDTLGIDILAPTSKTRGPMVL